MPWSKSEQQDQQRMQLAVEEQLKKGPTGKLPPLEEVNQGRQTVGLEPVSEDDYNEELARRAKSAM